MCVRGRGLGANIMRTHEGRNRTISTASLSSSTFPGIFRGKIRPIPVRMNALNDPIMVIMSHSSLIAALVVSPCRISNSIEDFLTWLKQVCLEDYIQDFPLI